MKKKEIHSPGKAGNRVLVKELPSGAKRIRVIGPEAHHLIRVMRRQRGDVIEVIDGRGGVALCRIIEVHRPDPSAESPIEVEMTLEEHHSAGPNPARVRTVIFVGILKGEAMEWVVEKAVELGVDELVPLVLDHTVVKVDAKGPDAFRARWQRLADQALKQSGRKFALEVSLPVALLAAKKRFSLGSSYFFDESMADDTPHFLDEALLFWSNASPRHAQEIHLLIGPEGGWSARERQELSSVTRRVHLGRDRILRAETAALQAISISTAIRDSKVPALS
jgi:16S rRNA (uracil1498-N3)-methyltransferase